jgi:HlyD family secretion protein
MKRRAALFLAGLAAVAAAIVLFTFPANEDAEFPGYMEADLVLVGSEQGGRVLTLSVEEGDRVKEGDPIFTLESEEQDASVCCGQGAPARARGAARRCQGAVAKA